MAYRYYFEFDFYRRILDIIDNDNNSESKLKAIKCAIMDQFNNYCIFSKRNRVIGHFDAKGYFYFKL